MAWRYRNDEGHFISKETYDRIEGGSRESDKHYGVPEVEVEEEEEFEGESEQFDDLLPYDWYDYDEYYEGPEYGGGTDYGEE